MTHDPDDEFDPDDPVSPAELAHARGFGDLVDRAVGGRGVPAAMSADDRALVEVATVIRGAAGRIALTDARATALVDAALLAAVDRDRPRSVSVPPPLGAPHPPEVIAIASARSRSRLPWIAATIATAIAAAAIALLVARPARPAPAAPPVAVRHTPDQLVGVITRDRAGDAAARIDVIYADRLDGWREQGVGGTVREDPMITRRTTGWLAVAALAGAVATSGVVVGCAGGDEDRAAGTTRLADPADLAGTISQELLVALAQAKNFHHKAKVYMTDGNLTEASLAVRQILAIRFPSGAPEAEDVRQDARALLAKLLVAQGKLDEAMKTVDDGIASATRESFFLANLHTVRGEVFEAQAAIADDGTAAGKAQAATAKRAAIGAYDRSIAINEALQKRLASEPR